jgi:hypothetical protein
MTQADGDRRALARIEDALRRSDPRLVAMLSTFDRIHQRERMPARQPLTRRRRPGRLHRSGPHRPGPRRRLRASRRSPNLLEPQTSGANAWAGGSSGSWFGRWRLYPPLPPGSRNRRGFRPFEILSLVMATCALGVMVVLFTVLGHAKPATTQTRAGSCTPTVLMTCQPTTGSGGTGSAGTSASRKGAAG